MVFGHASVPPTGSGNNNNHVVVSTLTPRRYTILCREKNHGQAASLENLKGCTPCQSSQTFVVTLPLRSTRCFFECEASIEFNSKVLRVWFKL